LTLPDPHQPQFGEEKSKEIQCGIRETSRRGKLPQRTLRQRPERRKDGEREEAGSLPTAAAFRQEKIDLLRRGLPAHKAFVAVFGRAAEDGERPGDPPQF
jgi:hypothetical protein